MKKCVKCGIEKEEKQFAKTYKKKKDNSTPRRSNCRQCDNKRRQKSYQLNPITGIMSNIKSRCKRDGIPFDITETDVPIPERCPLLNIPLKRGVKGDYDGSPTVDRIIPELGYIKGNVRVISMMANRMKSNATLEQLEEFYKNIFDYMKNK